MRRIRRREGTSTKVAVTCGYALIVALIARCIVA
jgi:hypothetical protein